MLQIAVFSYPDLTGLPPNVAMEEMLKHFRSSLKSKGVSTLLYDDPNASFIFDSQLIKHFNSILINNPEYILPEVFYKSLNKIYIFHRVSKK